MTAEEHLMEEIDKSSCGTSSDDIKTPPFSPLSNTDAVSILDRSSDSEITTPSQLQIPIPPSFKLIGDNVDKTVKPREETIDSHAKSLHYFHSFAVKDRCDITGLPDNPGMPDMDNIDVDVVLPTEVDHLCLKKNMTVLMTRIIHKHLKFFNENVIVEWHMYCNVTSYSLKNETTVTLEQDNKCNGKTR